MNASDLRTLAVMTGMLSPNLGGGGCGGGGGVAVPSDRPTLMEDPKGWALNLCGVGAPGAAQPMEARETNAAPTQTERPLFLRVCVLSATELAGADLDGLSDPYVEVYFNQRTLATEAQSRTVNPVWEASFDFEMFEKGLLQFRIMDKDLLRKATFLGDASIAVPFETARLKREVLQLENVPASWCFGRTPRSRLTVLWQVVESLEDQPDLLELSKRAVERADDNVPQEYTVAVNILESNHSREHFEMLSAIRVKLGSAASRGQHQVSPFGHQQSAKYVYEVPRIGWTARFTLPDFTFEDMVQTRLSLDWIMRPAQGSEWQDLVAAAEEQLREAEQLGNLPGSPFAGGALPVGTAAAKNGPDVIGETRAAGARPFASPAAVAAQKASPADAAAGVGGGALAGGEDAPAAAAAGDGEGGGPVTGGGGGLGAALQAAVDVAANVVRPAAAAGAPDGADGAAAAAGGDATGDVNPLRRLRAERKARQRAQQLQAELRSKASNRLEVYGSFSISLDEIFGFCRDVGVQWAAQARLRFKSITVGAVLLHVDVRAMKDGPRSKIDLFLYPPPVVKGILAAGAEGGGGDAAGGGGGGGAAASAAAASAPAGGSGGGGAAPRKEVTCLYMYSYADFLPKMDADLCRRTPNAQCDPFFTVSVDGLPAGQKRAISAVVRHRQREVEWDPVAVSLPAERTRQRIVVEFFDTDVPAIGGTSFAPELISQRIGEARLSSAPLDRPLWFHLFGGAIGGKRGDFDTAMIRGACNPASTYHGSACLLFSASRTRPRGWPPYPDVVGVPVRVEVALFRGLYLPAERYRDKEVVVLVQVPGCSLDVTGPTGVPVMPASGLGRAGGGARGKRAMSQIPPSNADILGFPGRVDSRGVLRFFAWDRPKADMRRAYESARRAWERFGRERGERPPRPLETEPDTAWVARTSNVVHLLPQVEQCFVYIMLNGEEDKPPAIFGKFPLRFSEDYSDYIRVHMSRQKDDLSWPPKAALAEAKKMGGWRRRWGAKRRQSAGRVDPRGTGGWHGGSATAATRALARGGGAGPADSALDLSALGRTALDDRRRQRRTPSDWQTPEWVPLYWDESVVAPPVARYPSTFAGAICGSAKVILVKENGATDAAAAAAAGGAAGGVAAGAAGGAGRQPAVAAPPGAATAPAAASAPLDGAEAVSRYVAELSAPQVDENKYVPEPERSEYLFGFDSSVKRVGAPGAFIRFERLSPVPGPLFGSPFSAGSGPTPGRLTAARAPGPSPTETQLYLHADLLQARQLPALDADGLLNPFWELDFEDQTAYMLPPECVARTLENVPNSTNPSFLQRAVVAAKVHCPLLSVTKLPGNPRAWLPPYENCAVPPPPVVVRLYDLDCDSDAEDAESEGGSSSGSRASEPPTVALTSPAVLETSEELVTLPVFAQSPAEAAAGSGGATAAAVRSADEIFKDRGISRELVGLFVEWSPVNLDQETVGRGRELLGKPGAEASVAALALQPNECHKPMWYSLQSVESAPYEAVEGSDFAFQSLAWTWKARVLACFGYSLSGPAHFDALCRAYLSDLELRVVRDGTGGGGASEAASSIDVGPRRVVAGVGIAAPIKRRPLAGERRRKRGLGAELKGGETGTAAGTAVDPGFGRQLVVAANGALLPRSSSAFPGDAPVRTTVVTFTEAPTWLGPARASDESPADRSTVADEDERVGDEPAFFPTDYYPQFSRDFDKGGGGADGGAGAVDGGGGDGAAGGGTAFQRILWPIVNLASGHELTGCEVAFYRFEMDLLGVRGLGVRGVPVRAEDHFLNVTSFWGNKKGKAVEFSLPEGALPSPNLRPPRVIQASFLDALRLVDAREEEGGEAFAVVGDPAGVQVRSPIFSTPTLPYLQRPGGRGGRSRLRHLMPDVTLRVRTGDGEVIGTLSISLQEFFRFPQGAQVVALQKKVPALAKLLSPSLAVAMENGRESGGAVQRDGAAAAATGAKAAVAGGEAAEGAVGTGGQRVSFLSSKPAGAAEAADSAAASAAAGAPALPAAAGVVVDLGDEDDGSAGAAVDPVALREAREKVGLLLPPGQLPRQLQPAPEEAGIDFRRINCDPSSVVSVFVDCFSCTAGDLLYDDDVVVGRFSTDHNLFHVQPAAKDAATGRRLDPVTHLFNPDDYFLGSVERQNMPFVQPILRLAAPGYGGPGPEEYRLWFEELFNPDNYFDMVEDFCKNCGTGCKESWRGCRTVCGDCCRKKKEPKKADGELSREKANEDFAGPGGAAAPPSAPRPPKLQKILTQTLEVGKWKNENSKTKFCLGTWLRHEGHKIDFGENSWGSRIVARFQMMRRTTEEERGRYGLEHVGTWNAVNVSSQIEGVVVWRMRQPNRAHWWSEPAPDGAGDEPDGGIAAVDNYDYNSHYFKKAGEVFMVIQSSRDNRFYAVVIPSFDLRYPQENGFFVINTLTQCFLNVEEIAIAQKLREFEELLKVAKRKEQIQDIENRKFTFQEQMRNLNSTDRKTKDYQCHLGYDTPISIMKGSFVCRLMKLGGGLADRAESLFWFDVMRALPPFNLVKELAVSEDRLPLATLKGALRVEAVPAAVAQERQAAATSSSLASAGPRYEQPALGPAPKGHKWVVEALRADIYVLTGRSLDNIDFIGKSDPYIVVSCNGHEERSDIVWNGDLNPNFYERFSLPLHAPGDALLRIAVMDRGEGLAKDALIGHAHIDLEERWLALQHARLEWKEKTDALLREEADGKVAWVMPAPRPPIEIVQLTRGNETAGAAGVSTGTLRFFVDIQPIGYYVLQDAGREFRARCIRAFTQVSLQRPEHADAQPLPIERLRVSEEFELRLILWNVQEISVFKDAGQRNDLFVECTLRFVDCKYVEQVYTFRTDVHEYSSTEAYFNWRIVVPVKLPLLAAEAKFTLLDADPTLPPRPVYVAEKRPLDDLLRTQMARMQHGDPLLPAIDYKIEFSEPVFDSAAVQWFRATCCRPLEPLGCSQRFTRAGCGVCCAPERLGEPPALVAAPGAGTAAPAPALGAAGYGEEAPDLCAWCLTAKQRRRRELQKKAPVRPAVLVCTIEALPKSAAEKHPVGTERNGPDALPDPPHRFQRGMMWRDPVGFLRIVLGPATCAAIQIGTIVGAALVGLLMLSFIIALIVIAARV